MAMLSYRMYLAAMPVVAAVWVVPAAILLCFGDRPDSTVIAPDTSLVSAAPDCVMFCDQPAPVTTPGKPACTFWCDEPPLPSDSEVCQLFSGRQGC